MHSRIDLNGGGAILNITHLIRKLEDFTAYLIYLVDCDKEDLFMWFKLTELNRVVFETVMPLYEDVFNDYDKRRFLTDGCIFVDKGELFGSYPVGRDQQLMWKHKKRLVLEKVYYSDDQ